MRTGTLAFLLGIIAMQFFSSLPTPWLVLLPVLFIPFFSHFQHKYRVLLPLLFLVAGFSWQLLHAHWVIASRLPATLEGEDIIVEGVVTDLPRHEGQISRFTFRADKLLSNDLKEDVDWLLRLKWYGKQRPAVHSGQRWQFTVRLKRPHGFINPGTFDYEKWLFSQGVSATGYVRSKEPYLLLKESGQGLVFWQPWRESLINKITRLLDGHEMTGIVRALAAGDRSEMTKVHWEVLTRTGTNHLVAISGLHIGLVAGFVFWLSQWLVRQISWLCLRQPARVYAAVLAIIAAVCYAALAGFSVPTQRALIMVSVLMLDIVLRRKTASLDTLALAMLLVLLFDPFSALSAGFWLSFAAVAVIFLSLTGRLHSGPAFRQWGAVQWVVSIGLLPFLVILFGRISLAAPLTNLVAVPWISFISVPLLMLSMAGLFFDSGLLLTLAADSLALLWKALDWVAGLPLASVYLPDAPYWTRVSAVIGVAWLLMPRGMPVKWLGVICLLPMLLIKPLLPAHGAYSLSVLDVGQGLAIVVQTAKHVLLYDTGARFSPEFDIGNSVILPVLRYRGIKSISTLMVSHGDGDHNGGTLSVVNGLPLHRSISGEPMDMPVAAEHCVAGQAWHWDGVNFEVLSPALATPLAKKTNNRSCVLRIDNGNKSSLLTGDIEAAIERQLLVSKPEKLAATILVAPHHGSKSSSTSDFIRAIQPDHVVFSVGYRNRYRFPRESVRERYLQQGSTLYQTDKNGMLVFDVPVKGDMEVRAWRQEGRRYWHAE